MSTVYSSQGTRVTPQTGANTRQTISGATNASPIAITCTSHGFSMLDTVEVAGVLGNTAANGLWQITVVDANTFKLNGSTGNGAYTSGGYAIDFELTPAATLAANGELVDAGVIGATFEAAIDPTSFLYMRCGSWRTYDIAHAEHADKSAGVWSDNSSTASGYVVMANAGNLLTAIAAIGFGDWVELTFTGSFESQGAGVTPVLMFGTCAPGGTISGIDASGLCLPGTADFATTLSYTFQPGQLLSGIQVGLVGWAPGTSTLGLVGIGSWSLTLKHWKEN